MSFFSFSNKKGVILLLFIWFLIFTPFSTYVDLSLSHYFYNGNSFSHRPLWHEIFLYGCYPAWIIGLSSFIFCIYSFVNPKVKKWQRATLFLSLTFLMGCGLIVNVLLKDHWGRPRPRQLIEFGGSHFYSPYYLPHFIFENSNEKSFPSGHASCGFYFFSLAFLGAHYKKRWLFFLGLTLAFGLGTLLSLSRIAEGGHFLSDTLAAALIMWLISWGLGYCIFFHPEETHGRTHS